MGTSRRQTHTYRNLNMCKTLSILAVFSLAFIIAAEALPNSADAISPEALVEEDKVRQCSNNGDCSSSTPDTPYCDTRGGNRCTNGLNGNSCGHNDQCVSGYCHTGKTVTNPQCQCQPGYATCCGKGQPMSDCQ